MRAFQCRPRQSIRTLIVAAAADDGGVEPGGLLAEGEAEGGDVLLLVGGEVVREVEGAGGEGNFHSHQLSDVSFQL